MSDRAQDPLLSCVLCYYNEADWIAATIQSLAAQSDRRFELILVDNASTDNSTEIARDAVRALNDVPVTFLTEAVPGKIHALACGTAAASARYVATMDADTIYPRDYVAKVLKGFDQNPDASAVLAFGLAHGSVGKTMHRKLNAFARYLPRKCHTGGYGQNFRRTALEQAGGFDPRRWPHVLEDHEIIHRVMKYGPLVYDRNLYCHPSDRRADRSDCSWNLAERIAYKLLPAALIPAYFDRFLASRFERRGLGNLRLREGSWRKS